MIAVFYIKMADFVDLDERIKQLANSFSSDEIVLCGGLAVYLATKLYRNTDDIDVIILKNEVGRKISNYQKETGVRVDFTLPDNVFDSLDLSDDDLVSAATRIKKYDTGEEIKYLCPEALIVNKLTSFCLSGEQSQPTKYGVNVLRDKDLDDIKNLLREELDHDLMFRLLGTVPQLEEVDVEVFYEYAIRAINEPSAHTSFVKNAFGLARYIAQPESKSKEDTYQKLLKESRLHQISQFALHLDDLYHHNI